MSWEDQVSGFGLPGARCRVRTELERFTRFATLRLQLLQSTVGRTPPHYGCLSVCELNICKERFSKRF